MLVATLVGYGIWSRLMATYPSSTVAPFSMLVPVVGVLASVGVRGEVPDVVEIAAGVVVVAAVLWSSRAARPRALPVSTAGVPVPVLSPGAGDARR